MPGIADTVHLGAAPAAARVLCVLVHGRDQSPDEMQTAIARHLQTPGVALALPRAIDACWYTALAISALTDRTRAELDRSLSDLAALIGDLRARAPGLPLVLAGFSQGACLAVEHAFAGLESPQAVVALTGCRVGQPGDSRARALSPGLPVYLSAGDADPWIPLAAFGQTVDELAAGKARLRCDVFPGRPHQIAPAEIAMLDATLADLAAGRAPGFEAAR